MLFRDTSSGVITVDKGITGKKFLSTKDSTSKSGHSLVAQIPMTHSGIITGNRAFYMPDRMKAGAHHFVKDYQKPVLIGHDTDTQSVGRVIEASYIDTMAELCIKDKYADNLYRFLDKKNKDTGKKAMVDFAQHMMLTYCNKDTYKGAGHILGTFKISDEETICRILDGRDQTVSTSFKTNNAFCSECGQDWMTEGRCDHELGGVYDSGIPVVIIPGNMIYDHVGIVTVPADHLAAGFNILQVS